MGPFVDLQSSNVHLGPGVNYLVATDMQKVGDAANAVYVFFLVLLAFSCVFSSHLCTFLCIFVNFCANLLD